MALLISIIFLVLLPLGQWIRLDLGNGLSLIPLDAGVGLLSTFFLLKNYKKIHGELLKPIYIFVAVLTVSLIINFKNLESRQFLIAGAYLLRIIFYFSFYFLILNYAEVKKNLPKFMIFSGALLLLIGFIQYIFYPDLRNLYYLGWDEHLYRLFSSFLDPNFAGSFFVLYLIFLAGILKNKTHYLLIGLTFVAIFLTYSRSAYLMLVVSALSFLVIKKQFKLTLGFIVLFLFSLFILSKTSLSSEGTNLLRTASGQARLNSVNNAITIFRNNPIFGVGFDAYRFAQHKYGFITKNWENIHSGAGTDNSFLFVLATSGLVGFLSYIYLLSNILKVSMVSKDKYSIILFSSLIGIIFNSFFVNSLFYPPVILWLMALLGLRENK